MNNPFVGFETFSKQLTDDEEHPHGEDSHLDDDSILERHGDVETDDNYYEPDDDVDLQWGKVSDAAKGAVGAAKSGAAKVAQTAQTAGTAVGAKVGQAAQTAGHVAQDAAKTGIAAGQQAAQTAGYAAQDAARTGMDAAQTAGTAAGAKVSDAAQTAKGFGQAAGAVAGQKAAGALQTGVQAAQTAGTQAVKTAQDAGAAAGQKVAGAFGKSHDDMMTSLDQAIGFMEKQVEIDEEDYYGDPNIATSTLRGNASENIFDAPEDIEDFDYDDPAELNTAQREAVQEVARNRQQGVAENESLTASPEAAEYMELVRRLEKVVSPSGEIREPEANDSPSPSPVASAERRGVAKNIRRPSQTKGQRVLTPENIATSAVEDRADRAVQAERSKRSAAKKAEMAAAREAAQAQIDDSSITPMSGPNTSSYSDEDDLDYSADNILAKALGSVIGIMEKQFSCQECGTKIPKSSKKCRKCGSEDIDLS